MLIESIYLALASVVLFAPNDYEVDVDLRRFEKRGPILDFPGALRFVPLDDAKCRWFDAPAVYVVAAYHTMRARRAQVDDE